MTQGFRKEKVTGEVRLNKFISDSGFCSRREADRLIEQRRVQVDGVVVMQGTKVSPGQQVTVNGQPLTRENEMILLAVNKPRGIVCTTDKRWGDETIYDLLNYPKRVFSIGRLDKDSEGLLLMTNNGDILNKIMRAGNYHEKEYLVTVNREITPDFLKKMSEGVYLKELEVKTRPCRVELAGKCQFRIILTQGLNRQIRRMCEALHYKVTRLQRMRIMNIELGDLKPGEYRSVTRKELAALKEQLKYSTNPGQETAKSDKAGAAKTPGKADKAGAPKMPGRSGKAEAPKVPGKAGKTGAVKTPGRSGNMRQNSRKEFRNR